MIDHMEKVLKVNADPIAVVSVDVFLSLQKCVVSASFGPESKGGVRENGLEDWTNYLGNGLLDQSVQHRWHA